MAEEDIAYLLSRGELAEPLETEQSEINKLVDKSEVKDIINLYIAKYPKRNGFLLLLLLLSFFYLSS
jgi:hypothetical protein